MTDNEIIKALEEWAERGFSFCNVGMPEFSRNILSLINRLKTENERLQALVDELTTTLNLIKLLHGGDSL